MKIHSAVLATILLTSTGFASAQSQKASPAKPNATGSGISGSATGESVNIDTRNPSKSDMSGTSTTTGAGSGKTPTETPGASTGPDAPINNGGATPSGLTRE
jgi:hypothetical protein